MSRYIDAEWLLGVAKLSNGVVDIDDIYNAPTIDAVSVVRCKECWHSKRIDSADGVFTHMCDISDLKWRADDFCSYGEREDE